MKSPLLFPRVHRAFDELVNEIFAQDGRIDETFFDGWAIIERFKEAELKDYLGRILSAGDTVKQLCINFLTR